MAFTKVRLWYPPSMKSQRDAYGSELMAVYQGKKNTLEIVELTGCDGPLVHLKE